MPAIVEMRLRPSRAHNPPGPGLTSVCVRCEKTRLCLTKDQQARRDPDMSPDHEPTPATIIGALLTSHPEAASLLAEASHWRCWPCAPPSSPD